MKTVEEFLKELDSSKELRKELAEAKGREALEEILKKNGCGFAAEDLLKAFGEISSEGELSDDDAVAVAGGGRSPIEDYEEDQRYFIYKGWGPDGRHD